MPAPFAALESRVNNAVFARLANTQAQLNGGAAVPVIFDDLYAMGAVGVSGISTSAPVLTVATANVPANPVGKTASVNAVSYLIAEHQPDGTGVSRLLLEVAG